MAPPSTGTPLTVCIDDYGLHPGVNDAALALAGMGRLHAISCMVGAPHWVAGAPALRGLAGGPVDVGLHLDFTECPLLASNRRSLPRLIALTTARLLDPAAMRQEIEAQFDAFELGMGRPPDHVDGHQHVHQFPLVRDLLLQVLKQRYPHTRPWLRSTRRPDGPGSRGLKPWVIERLGCEQLARLALAGGYRQNSHLLGAYDFQGDVPRYQVLLAQWLAAAQPGDLLMCHAAADAPANDAIGQARRNEHHVFTSPAFDGLLAAAGVRLARLGAHGSAYAASL